MTTSKPRVARRHFRCTKIKLRALRYLSDYFCLRVIDLAGLLYGEATQINRIPTSRTLRTLKSQGYVARIRYLDIDQDFGGASYVYGLSDRGVAQFGGKTFGEHSARTLDHELDISHFHIALQRMCDANGLQLYWRQTDLKKKSIHPDALFAITDPTKPANANTHWFFLEIERSKLGKYKDGEPSIVRKLAKYHTLFNTDDCVKDWRVRQFRVITVLSNDERRATLLRALKERHSHRMFWITSEAACEQNIGGRIFLTPKDHEAKSYSFLEL